MDQGLPPHKEVTIKPVFDGPTPPISVVTTIGNTPETRLTFFRKYRILWKDKKRSFYRVTFNCYTPVLTLYGNSSSGTCPTVTSRNPVTGPVIDWSLKRDPEGGNESCPESCQVGPQILSFTDSDTLCPYPVSCLSHLPPNVTQRPITDESVLVE